MEYPRLRIVWLSNAQWGCRRAQAGKGARAPGWGGQDSGRVLLQGPNLWHDAMLGGPVGAAEPVQAPPVLRKPRPTHSPPSPALEQGAAHPSLRTSPRRSASEDRLGVSPAFSTSVNQISFSSSLV